MPNHEGASGFEEENVSKPQFDVKFLESAGSFSIGDIVTIQSVKKDLTTIRRSTQDGVMNTAHHKISDFTDWKIVSLFSDPQQDGRILAVLTSDSFNEGVDQDDRPALTVDLSEIKKN